MVESLLFKRSTHSLIYVWHVIFTFTIKFWKFKNTGRVDVELIDCVPHVTRFPTLEFLYEVKLLFNKIYAGQLSYRILVCPKGKNGVDISTRINRIGAILFKIYVKLPIFLTLVGLYFNLDPLYYYTLDMSLALIAKHRRLGDAKNPVFSGWCWIYVCIIKFSGVMTGRNI